MTARTAEGAMHAMHAMHAMRSPQTDDEDDERVLAMAGNVTVAEPTDTMLLIDIQHFYARQMQELDAGRHEAWAATFTPDGTFVAPGRPEPVSGREALAKAAAVATAEHAEQGLVLRHWLGMLTLTPRPDARVFTRCYALVLVTPLGGTPTLHRSTVCEDLLSRQDDGTWLVEHRRVSRDDLPSDSHATATPTE